MKKLLSLLLTFGSFLPLAVHADTTCSVSEQSELNKKASNVSIDFEIKNEVLVAGESPITRDYIDLTIFNITDDFYITINNDYNREELVVSNSETQDGMYNLKWTNTDKVTNFTVKVYASSNTGCNGELVKTLTQQTPRFNEYASRDVCNEISDFYLCQPFVNYRDVDEDLFIEQVLKYKEGLINKNGEAKDNKTLTDRIFEFLDRYKWVMLGSILVIGAAGGTFYYVSTKKQRDLGL